MHKKVVSLIVAVAFVFGGISTAQAAGRQTADRSTAAPAKSTVTRSVTLQRLLGDSLERALKLIGALDSVTPIGAGTNTIIDEPDPAGYDPDGSGKDDRKDNEKTDEEILEQELIDAAGTQQKSVFG